MSDVLAMNLLGYILSDVVYDNTPVRPSMSTQRIKNWMGYLTWTGNQWQASEFDFTSKNTNLGSNIPWSYVRSNMCMFDTPLPEHCRMVFLYVTSLEQQPVRVCQSQI